MNATSVVLVLFTALVLPHPTVAQTTTCIHLNDRITRCETMPDMTPSLPPQKSIVDRTREYTDAIRRDVADVWFQRAMRRLQSVVTVAAIGESPTSPLTLQPEFPAAEWRELTARLPEVLFVSTVQEARDALDHGKRLMTSQARQKMGLDP